MRRRGFTLLELVVVLIVLSALIAIALPQYTLFVEKGRAAEAINAMSAIKAGEEVVRLGTGNYTGNINRLGVTLSNTKWTYGVTASGSASFQATATRNGGTNNGTTMTMTYTSAGVTSWTGDDLAGRDNELYPLPSKKMNPMIKNNTTGSKYVPLIIIALSIWIVSLMPLKIMSYGYMPLDDALRHAGKAVSGKDWHQILLMRDEIKIDSHFGWHVILRTIYLLTKCDTFALVTFSVTALFVLFSLTGILLLRRPEAWLFALLTICVSSMGPIFRLLIGRPYIITMSVVLIICLAWPKLREKKNPYGLLTVLTTLIAAATWAHCSWYLFALPAASFFLAREWRAGFRVSAATAAGIILGAAFTGHFIIFLKQTIYQMVILIDYNKQTLTRLLVSEQQPFNGDMTVITLVALMLIWRVLRRGWDRKAVENPVFMLLASSWAIGFFTTRIWADLGIPALAAYLALEFQDFLEHRMPRLSWKRVALTAVLLCVLYPAITHDGGGRWSSCHPSASLSMNNPEHTPWLPGPGGIIYSDEMGIFYTTFYRNPNAPWKYALGDSPLYMPKEDLDIFKNIQRSYRSDASFEPWVKKMKLQDRLIILNPQDKKPTIPGLEWHNIPDVLWIGRLPLDRKASVKK